MRTARATSPEFGASPWMQIVRTVSGSEPPSTVPTDSSVASRTARRATSAGAEMNGTLLVVQAASLQAVRDFVDGDPYVAAGVYDRVEIRPWRCGLGPLSELS